MNEIITGSFLLLGSVFLLLAAVGVVRMPDLYTRMQPATKAVTLGISLLLFGAAVFFGRIGVTTRAIATIVFFFLTAPLTAHLIGRAAYVIGVPLWKGTLMDELQGRYDLPNKVLDSPPQVVLYNAAGSDDPSLAVKP